MRATYNAAGRPVLVDERNMEHTMTDLIKTLLYLSDQLTWAHIVGANWYARSVLWGEVIQRRAWVQQLEAMVK